MSGGCIIPTDDALAYALYPEHRCIYNKLRICETQGLVHGPHGIAPTTFPVFSKPIYNLRGMGLAAGRCAPLSSINRRRRRAICGCHYAEFLRRIIATAQHRIVNTVGAKLVDDVA